MARMKKFNPSSFGFTTQQAATALDWLGSALAIVLIVITIWWAI